MILSTILRPHFQLSRQDNKTCFPSHSQRNRKDAVGLLVCFATGHQWTWLTLLSSAHASTGVTMLNVNPGWRLSVSKALSLLTSKSA